MGCKHAVRCTREMDEEQDGSASAEIVVDGSIGRKRASIALAMWDAQTVQKGRRPTTYHAWNDHVPQTEGQGIVSESCQSSS